MSKSIYKKTQDKHVFNTNIIKKNTNMHINYIFKLAIHI
jgi:hypothetical protein